MNITAGWAKGQKLHTPRGQSTRPTTAKVREAVFSILGDKVIGASFLDFFAGSGAMGLEALSRGAKYSVFIEKDAVALECLRKNIAELERRARAQGLPLAKPEIIARDARKAWEIIKTHGPFQLVWADAPYRDTADWLVEFDKVLPEFTQPGSSLLIEAAADLSPDLFPDKLGHNSWEMVRRKKYGDSQILYWQRKGDSA